MGSWGAGLYSDDFALDLRADIAGITRLPFGGDELLTHVCSLYDEVPNHRSHDEYARFWLVLADQFQKRGIKCETAFAKALDVIDSGADREVLASLGMPEPALRKRNRVLTELRSRLVAGAQSRPRRALKTPQKLIMQPGEVFAYPTWGGAPFNPYVSPADEKRYFEMYPWQQDGWGALLIVKAEIAYGYLAWYYPIVTLKEIDEKPTLESLANATWTLRAPGTCSPSHFKRLKLGRLGQIALEAAWLSEIPCSDNEGASAALRDASISNWMDIASDRPKQNKFIQRYLNAMPIVTVPKAEPRNFGPSSRSRLNDS